MKNIAELTTKNPPNPIVIMKGWVFLFLIVACFLVLGSSASAQVTCAGDGSPSDLTCGLVGWWTFDEMTGTLVADSSGNGNTGTASGTTIVSGCPMGMCRSFNGTSDYVNAGTLGSFGANDAAMSTTGMSWSVWFRTTSTSVNILMGNTASSGTAGIFAALNQNLYSSPTRGSLYFSWRQNANYGIYGTATTGNAIIYDGKWHHWVVIISAGLGSMQMYLDGASLGTSVYTEGFSKWETWSITPYLAIGANVNSTGILSDYFAGSIDDLRIYNRSLSLLDVTALYSAGEANISSSASVSGAETYYIDYNSGNDNNNGLSKNSPWQRAPGMNGFTGTYNNSQAGDHFIFKGGVTWPNSVFPFNISYSGISGNPVYYGVDKTWYSGSSWVRPLFDLNYTVLPGNGVPVDIEGQTFVTIDNIEIAHMAIPATAPYGSSSIATGFSTASNNITIQNSYIHDWRPLSTTVDQDNGGIFFNTGTGNVADSNTVGPGQAPDGTYNAASGSCIRNGSQVSNNSLTNCSDMYIGGAQLIYGNTFSNSRNSFQQNPVFHPNAIWHNNTAGQTTYIYNNIFNGQDTQYQLMLLHPGWSGATNSSYYIYNNVFWNVNNINIDESGIVAANSNTNAYVFNNTCSNGAGDCLSIVNRQQTYHLTLVEAENNHWITDFWSGNGFVYNGVGGSGTAGTIIDTNNITQATVAATSQGYTLANLFAPNTAADITVNAGINLSGLGINSLDQDKLGNARPASGAWDIGAYEYNGTNAASGLLGDVIDTGHVTIYDAELTAQYAIGLTVPGFDRRRAQVDGNSTVDIYDAYLIAEYAIGLINKFPVQNN